MPGRRSVYRPISLTSQIGKIYERIVKRRLNHFCESKGVIPLCQAGCLTTSSAAGGARQESETEEEGRCTVASSTCVVPTIPSGTDGCSVKSRKVGLSGQMYNFV